MMPLSESPNFKTVKLTLISLLIGILVVYIIGVGIAFYDYKETMDTIGRRYSEVNRTDEDEQHVKRVIFLVLEIAVTFGALVGVKKEHFGASFISAIVFLISNMWLIDFFDVRTPVAISFILTTSLLVFLFSVLIYHKAKKPSSQCHTEVSYVQPYDVVYR